MFFLWFAVRYLNFLRRPFNNLTLWTTYLAKRNKLLKQNTDLDRQQQRGETAGSRSPRSSRSAPQGPGRWRGPRGRLSRHTRARSRSTLYRLVIKKLMWNTVQSSFLNVPTNIFFKQFFKRYSVKAITSTKARSDLLWLNLPSEVILFTLSGLWQFFKHQMKSALCSS